MSWRPITEVELSTMIEAAEMSMEPVVERFWKRIRVRPEKWSLPPWGDEGEGFWVVAVIGHECFWYNDIEDGFNISTFEGFGHIGQYLCNQTELEPCVAGYYTRFVEWLGRDL